MPLPTFHSKSERRWKPGFSLMLYGDRNAIKRMFCHLKDFRRVATRHNWPTTNYLANVCLAAAVSY